MELSSPQMLNRKNSSVNLNTSEQETFGLKAGVYGSLNDLFHPSSDLAGENPCKGTLRPLSFHTFLSLSSSWD